MPPVLKERLQSLTDRPGDPNQLDACTEEIRRIRDEKWTSFSRSEGSCCLASAPDVGLFTEVDLPDQALMAMERRDAVDAASLFRNHLSNAD